MDDSTEQASACTAEGLHLLRWQWKAKRDGQERRQREPPKLPLCLRGRRLPGHEGS